MMKPVEAAIQHVSPKTLFTVPAGACFEVHNLSRVGVELLFGKSKTRNSYTMGLPRRYPGIPQYEGLGRDRRNS